MSAKPEIATVNMHEAKTRLSQFVDQVERGLQPEVVIARNGRPVAKLVPISPKKKGGMKLGTAKGKFDLPDWAVDLELNAKLDEDIARSMTEGSLFPEVR